MMWGWYGWSWWGWLLMVMGMAVFWGLVIWAVAAIFRGPGRTWWRADRPDPEQILAERFAMGEIDEDEYLRRLQTLRSTSHGAGTGSTNADDPRPDAPNPSRSSLTRT